MLHDHPARRTALELLDAAFLRVRHQAPTLLAISLSGTVPLAVALLWLVALQTEPHSPWVARRAAEWLVLHSAAVACALALRHAMQQRALQPQHAMQRRQHASPLAALATGACVASALAYGAALLVLPAWVIAARLQLVPAISACEQRYGWAALSRSWLLTAHYTRCLLQIAAAFAVLQLLLMINLHLGLPMVLWLLEFTAALDIAELSELQNLARIRYLAVLSVVAWVLLEPLRTSVAGELYDEILLHAHGHDLQQRVPIPATEER